MKHTGSFHHSSARWMLICFCFGAMHKKKFLHINQPDLGVSHYLTHISRFLVSHALKIAFSSNCGHVVISALVTCNYVVFFYLSDITSCWRSSLWVSEILWRLWKVQWWCHQRSSLWPAAYSTMRCLISGKPRQGTHSCYFTCDSLCSRGCTCECILFFSLCCYPFFFFKFLYHYIVHTCDLNIWNAISLGRKSNKLLVIFLFSS